MDSTPHMERIVMLPVGHLFPPSVIPISLLNRLTIL